jgi:hypothetical protein
MQRLQIHRRRRRRPRRTGAEHPGRALKQLGLPVRDLIGVHIKELRQLRQRLLTLDGR